MKKGIRNRCVFVVLLFSLACFLVAPSIIQAQKLTHTVIKGDTLWDICEKYYGDPDLWPKLWEMNPFVTNPHLLNPGDVLTLFEKEPLKEIKPLELPVEKAEEEPSAKGVNMEGLTEVNTLGYLSLSKISPLGTIFASEKSKIILGEDDTVFLIFGKGREVKIGEELSIGKLSPMLKHPLSGKELGQTFSVSGRLVIEKKLGSAVKYNRVNLTRVETEFFDKDNVYQAKINKIYDPIYVNDILMPYQPVSPCVLPAPINKETLANIVASKKQQVLINTNSIVYIDRGFTHGLNRGNIFEVVKTHLVKDPELPRDSKIILPDIPIAKVMVIESRPETSTAIVLSATESFSVGVYIKDVSWEGTPDFLSSLADCPIE